MLNNDDFNLLNTLFPAWQQLTTKQQQIISQNASLIQVKKIILCIQLKKVVLVF